MFIAWLVDFDQNAIAAFRMNEYHLGSVGARARFVGQKLVALLLQSRDIFLDIIGAKADVVQATAALLEVGFDRPLPVKRMYQLDIGRRQRKEATQIRGRPSLWTLRVS